MAYEEKIVGATCGKCGNGKYVRNPKTGKVFCDKKCWLTGSNTNTPLPQQNSSQVNFDHIQSELVVALEEKVASLELVVANMRTWATKVNGEMDSLKALVSTLTGENAVNLHVSVPPKATVQQAAEILGGRVEGEWEFPKKN